MQAPPAVETVLIDAEDHVATVTLNRPEKLNAANAAMLADFRSLWQWVREDDDIHVVVLRAAGERAFCTGLDRVEGFVYPANVWNKPDPGLSLSPKVNKVWKPFICAVNGMCAGGAFYWINEADIVISSDDATFFDPHVDFGLTAALEPIGLISKIGAGEVLRMFLLGLSERMSANRAREIGLVSEVVPTSELWDRAEALARLVAAKPSVATQGTVRAVWESLDVGRATALERALAYTIIGNPIGEAEAENLMKSGRRLPFEIR